jgi:hypothetical protein
MRSTMVAAALILTAPLMAGAQSHQHHASPAVSAIALNQIRDVEQAAQSLATPDLARAAGFEPTLGWIPMMGTHWVNGPRMLQGKKIDRAEPAQLMFSPVAGKETLVGVAYAYYAPVKDGDPPVIFDGAPAWHDHPDLAPPGTNLVMLHVWFVPSPDGPFSGMNPFLPYWAAGVTPPDVDRMRDPAFAVRVRTAALALAEIVDSAGLFPILARRPAAKPALDARRDAIRALIPQLEAARKANDLTRWDALLDTLGEHWNVMRETYIGAALDPNVKARLAKAIDEMIQGGHGKTGETGAK